MTKKIIDFMTTSLLILAAICALISFVGCGTKKETEVKVTEKTKTEEDIIQELEDKYNDKDEAEVYVHCHDDNVVNYYVTYVKLVREEKTESGTIYIYNTIADKYDTEGNFMESHAEQGLSKATWKKCMSYFDPVKP